MDRFVWDFWEKSTDMQKSYIIAKGIPYRYCIEKLGVIEDMIEKGQIPKKAVKEIEQTLKLRGVETEYNG